jgi:hypothetical protein
MTFPERKKVEMENSMKPWGDTSEVVTFDASVASKDFAFVHGNKIVIDRGAVML